MIIRTIIFYGVLYFWTIFLGIICVPYLFLPSKLIKFPALIWIKVIFFLLEKICGITHEIRGLENVPNEPLIIVSKHQSAFETFALYYYLNNCFFIHKKQLFYIPIFGQYLFKSNMVSINRSGGANTMRKMLHEVKIRMNTGSSIIIFPEGTRKKPGEKPDYKTGFVGIYKEVNRKILPVALNSGLFWPKQNFIIKKGHIVIDIKECIEQNLDKDLAFNLTREIIENATNKILL